MAGNDKRDPYADEVASAKALMAEKQYDEQSWGDWAGDAVGNALNTAKAILPTALGGEGSVGISDMARGAYEAGDETIGFNISLPREQHPNPYITEGLAFRFHYFALRKMQFMLRARAIVAYPGGFGSFDELFEVLTLMQTGKVAVLPVILVGDGFWSEVLNLQKMIEFGVIDKSSVDLIHFVHTAEEAWKVIVDCYQLA